MWAAGDWERGTKPSTLLPLPTDEKPDIEKEKQILKNNREWLEMHLPPE